MDDKWYNSDFASSLGIGILLFLTCCGIGTCSMLVRSKIEYVPKDDTVEKTIKTILDTTH